MTATLRLDETGRVLIPQDMRDHLHLAVGSTLKAEVVGERIQLSEEIPEVKIVRKEGMRVIDGWEGFDAAEAVREARERHIERLITPAKE